MMDISDSFDIHSVYSGVYSRANAANPDILKLLAVLEATKKAVEDNATSNNADPGAAVRSPTAFFGAFMTALEATGPAHAREIFYLLSLLLPHVPAGVIRAKFGPISVVFSMAFTAPSVTKDDPCLRSLLNCIGTVLAKQDPSEATWALVDTSRLFGIMLNSTTSPKPKVRKVAQTAMVDLFTAHHQAKSAEAAKASVNHFLTLLSASSQAEVAKLEQSFPMLSNCLPLIPVKQLEQLITPILRLNGLGSTRITVVAFEALTSLVESPKSRLTAGFCSKLASALCTMRPGLEDHAPLAQYCYALSATIVRLINTERIQAGLEAAVPTGFHREGVLASSSSNSALTRTNAVLAQVTERLVEAFKSDRVAVHHAAANSLAVVLTTSVDAHLVSQAVSWVTNQPNQTAVVTNPPAHAPTLVHVIKALTGILSFQCQSAWSIAFPVLGVMYRLLGPSSVVLLGHLTLSLCGLRKSLEKASQEAESLIESDEEDDKPRKRRRGKRTQDDPGSDDEAASNAHNSKSAAEDGFTGGKGQSAAVVFRILNRLLAVSVRSIGIGKYIELVDLCGGPIAEEKAWVIPLLRDNGGFQPCPISVFMGPILKSIQAEDSLAKYAVAENKLNLAKMHRTRVVQLWSLLPVIMVAPPDFDTQEGFGVALGKVLTSALANPTGEYPELITTVARAIETAIVRARAAAELPVMNMNLSSLLNDNEGDDLDGLQNDDFLTVMKGQTGPSKRSNRDSFDSDDDDDDDLSMGSDNRSNYDGASIGGASTLFGAGGVSVYGGAGDNDPRHFLLRQAMGSKSVSQSYSLDSADNYPSLTTEQGKKHVERLTNLSKNYLPVLFNAYELASFGAPDADEALSAAVANERSRKVLDAVTAYSTCTSSDVIAMLSGRLLQLLNNVWVEFTSSQESHKELLAEHKKAMEEGGKGPTNKAANLTGSRLASAKKALANDIAKLNSLLCLATALIPSLPALTENDILNEKLHLNQLLQFILNALEEDLPPRISKRVYGLFAIFNKFHPENAATQNIHVLLTTLCSSLQNMPAAAKRNRLLVILPLIRKLDLQANETHLQLLPSLVGEVILACKDGKGRVREVAFAVLLSMARSMLRGGQSASVPMYSEMSDDNMTGPIHEKANLTEFFHMVAAGIGGATPHMRSSAIVALSRLFYEYSTLPVIRELVPPLLETVLLLAAEKSREVVGSVASFCKVVASLLPPEELKPLVPSMLTALMSWSSERKDRIKARVRGLIERLIRRLGIEFVEPHVPPEDEPLMKYIKKMDARRQRRREQAALEQELAADEAASVASHTSRASRASRARTAFEDLVDLNNDEDVDDSESYEAKSSIWPGTVPLPVREKKHGGPGTYLSAVTAQMRAGSRLLLAAQNKLPPVGSVVDPNTLSKKERSMARTVISKALHQGGQGAKSVALTAKTAKSTAGGKTKQEDTSATIIHEDGVVDLMDSSAMAKRASFHDANTLKALEARRKRAQQADEAGLEDGFYVGKDGRLVIGGTKVEENDTELSVESSKKNKSKRHEDEMILTDESEDEDDQPRRDNKRAQQRSIFSKKRKDGASLPEPEQGWGREKAKNGSKTTSKSTEKTGGIQRGNKGKYANSPYMYIPLDQRQLSGAGGAASVNRFAAAVESGAPKTGSKRSRK